MKGVGTGVLIVIGVAVVAVLGFVGWGVWAFTPTRIPEAVTAQGELGGGVRYDIVRRGRGRSAQYMVHVGPPDVLGRFSAVWTEAGAPVPIAVSRIDGAQLEVRFDRALADGASRLRIPIDSAGVATTLFTIMPDGSTKAERAPVSDESLR